MKTVYLLLNYFICIPCFIAFKLSSQKCIIEKDVEWWLKCLHINKSSFKGLIHLLAFYPEFRTLFYKRLGNISYIFSFIRPRMKSLYIVTKDIGEGFFIQHGFSTIIHAKK